VKYKIPGIAVAVLERGQVSAIVVAGVRNQAGSSAVTPATVFPAGALGEPLYAYAVLRLGAEGHFNIGTPLTSDFPLPYQRRLDFASSSGTVEPLYDPRFNQITTLLILNHTSGMPDWARRRHLRLLNPPGQTWAYSNEGYLYLQQAVEHITGQAFGAFMMRSVLAPARMANSSFIWRDAYAKQIATGYDASGAPVEAERFPEPAATASLYTTITDYAQFLAMLLASAPAQRAHESAVSLMLRPTITVDSNFSWGLGCGLEKSGDELYAFHRGISAGFTSFFIASRTTGRAVIIFTNSGKGMDAVPDILSATIGGVHPALSSTFLRQP
jgi:CubicO group peptidase (beta-lactamase class C family)